jgi:hypothetical protein
MKSSVKEFGVEVDESAEWFVIVFHFFFAR